MYGSKTLASTTSRQERVVDAEHDVALRVARGEHRLLDHRAGVAGVDDLDVDAGLAVNSASTSAIASGHDSYVTRVIEPPSAGAAVIAGRAGARRGAGRIVVVGAGAEQQGDGDGGGE